MATLDLTKRDQVPIRSVITGDEEITTVVGNALYVIPIGLLIEAAATSVEWADIIGRPTTYPPSSHTHVPSDILGLGSLATKNSVTSDDIATDNAPSTGSFLSSENKWLVPSGAGDMLKSDNLAGLSSVPSSRSNLGLGSLAILNTVNNANWSGTDLSVANGGTGASTAFDARAGIGASPMRGYRDGLVMANDVTTPATNLAVSSGVAIDDTGVYEIRIASTFIKSIASTFVVGSGNGGLDTGTATAGVFYNLFVIGGAAVSPDVLISASRTSPVMPSGYTYKRYIGAINNTGTGLATFTQVGKFFRLKNHTAASPVSTTIAAAAGAQAVTLDRVPSGGVFRALLQYRTINAAVNSLMYIGSTADATPSMSSAVMCNIGNGVSNASAVGEVFVYTDASQQVTLATLSAGTTCDLYVRGWEDDYL